MGWHEGIPAEYRDQIVTGDARTLARSLPDESIDLVFTDPVYDRIEDYYWLGREAARVLRSDCSLLVFFGIAYTPAALQALAAGGLRFRWLLTANYAMRKQFHGRLQVNMTTCAWFEKGRARMFGSVGDSTTLPPVREARYGQSDGASWDKHPKIVRRYVEGFCPPAGVVWDPFCGLGTIPAHCKRHGRHFVAFEKQEEPAETARERVRNTPLPLLLPDAPDPQEVLALT